MALVSDVSYILHNLRLGHLRASRDSVSSSIIELPGAGPGDSPWIRASGGRDPRRWPEINGLRSPVPSSQPLPDLQPRRNPLNRAPSSSSLRQRQPHFRSRREPPPPVQEEEPAHASGSKLKYSQTIIGPGRSGAGAGMRVTGRWRPVSPPSSSRKGKEREAALPVEAEVSDDQDLEGRDVPGAFPTGFEQRNGRRRVHVRRTSADGSDPVASSASIVSRDDLYSPTSPFTNTNPFASLSYKPDLRSQAPISASLSSSPTAFDAGDRSQPDQPRTGGPSRKRSDSAPLPHLGSPVTPGFDGDDASISASASGGIDSLGEDDEEFLDEEDLEEDQEEEGYDDFGAGIAGGGLVVNGSMGTMGDVDGSDGELRMGREEEDMLESFDVGGLDPGRENQAIRELVKIADDDFDDDADEGDVPTSSSKKRRSIPRDKDASSVPALVSSFSHIDFSKSPVPPKKSGLSLIMDSLSSKAPTPFSTYGRILPPPAGTATAPPSLSLSIYFPHSKNPSKPLRTQVRKVSTVEEVVGLALFLYGESGLDPPLDKGYEEEGRERDIRLSTVGWGLRIVEDDGEVDEDFPALDRDANVAKFSFLEFAVTVATAAQVAQHLIKTPLPTRAPAALNASASMSSVNPSRAATAAGSSRLGSSNASLTEPSPMARIGAGGIPVLLKINVVNTADIRFSTTISVSSATYLADVLELVCKKKRIVDGTKDWVLCLADLSFVLPLDRTVESLMGVTDLALVRRTWAVSHGLKGGGERGGDPNASVFKDFHAVVPKKMISAFDATYRKYTVHRKAPIGRHERVLAIDGDYVHIMPSESRTHGFPSSMRTSSYHIHDIAGIKQSKKTPASFKLLVLKDGNYNKRYDLEADNGRVATEIVSIIKDLMRLYVPERRRAQPAVPLTPTSPNKIRRARPGGI